MDAAFQLHMRLIWANTHKNGGRTKRREEKNENLSEKMNGQQQK